MASHLFLPISLAIVFILIVRWRWATRLDPQEPPRVTDGFPVIGTFLGIARQGKSTYFPGLCKRNSHHPIFTIDLLFIKFYIVNSTKLISSVQRNAKSLSFEQFHTETAEFVGGLKGSGLDRVKEKRLGGEDLGLRVGHGMRASMVDDGLIEMNQWMIASLHLEIEKVERARRLSIDLFKWCIDTISVSALDGVYGPRNPYKSQGLLNEFWEVENHFGDLRFSPLPSVFSKKIVRAREKLVAAYIDYYKNSGHLTASKLVQLRYKMQHNEGATIEDIARLETMVPLVLLSNTVPACFWSLVEIMARPILLADIRDEITSNALLMEAPNLVSVDIDFVRNKCPLLLSTFQEVLRTHSVSASVRQVYDDVLLDDRFLLKKGAILQIPGAMMHYREDAWGPDVADFDPRRFIRLRQPHIQKQQLVGNSSEVRTIDPGNIGPTDNRAFIPFGFAPHLCPGRHFAAGEVLLLLAMLIVRFDIIPEKGRHWLGIETEEAVAGTMKLPTQPFKVTFNARSAYKDKKWTHASDRGSSGRVALLTG